MKGSSGGGGRDEGPAAELVFSHLRGLCVRGGSGASESRSSSSSSSPVPSSISSAEVLPPVPSMGSGSADSVKNVTAISFFG